MSTVASPKAVINLDVEGPVISRHVYGHFAEHLGRCIYDGFYVGPDSDIPNERGIRLDVVAALRALDIPNLRWPGGCFADEYHWRDGIGPKEDRPRMVNTHWGNVEENNHFGTHEFMDLCELLGADPYVSGNVGSGTVREMSEWVEYLTRDGDSPMTALRRSNGRDASWRVPFFGLGNETWGCGGNMRAQQYADLARQYGTYCRDHGEDKKLYRIAAGARDDDYAWTEALMQTLGTLGGTAEHPRFLQGVSFHYYTVPGPWEHKGSALDFSVEEYYRTMVQAQRVDTIIAGHSRVMDGYDAKKRIGLVLDEWGTWFDVEPGTNPGFLYQQNTLRDALVASLHFDIFHKHADRLYMANIAQTVNVLQAVLLTEGEHLVLTPTYHVFEMNKEHQDAASLQVHVLGGPPARDVGGDQLHTLSISASTKNDAALISITNLDAEAPVEVELDLRGRTVSETAARILTADELSSHNVAGGSAEVAARDYDGVTTTGGTHRVVLPPHSFVTVRATLG